MRRYGRQNDRPARVWQDVGRNWNISGSASQAATLLAFEAPAAGTLTAAPPEDITLLRIVGDFLSQGNGTGSYTLGLMIVDTGWTPALVATNGFTADADKRVLWHQTYELTGLSSLLPGFSTACWFPPGNLLVDATADFVTSCPREAVHLDITPKVKLEQGKSLALVAWENSGAVTYASTSLDMRVLYQRSRRR